MASPRRQADVIMGLENCGFVSSFTAVPLTKLRDTNLLSYAKLWRTKEKFCVSSG